MKKVFINKLIYKIILFSAILISSAFSAEWYNGKENKDLGDYSLQNSSETIGLRDSSNIKKQTSTPPESPSKKPFTRTDGLSVRDSNTSKTPSGSPPRSPSKRRLEKKSPPSSPTKAGVASCGDGASVDQNKLRSTARKKLFIDDSDKKDFKVALALSRESKHQQDAPKKNYLCALPSPETSRLIELAFQEVWAQMSLTQLTHVPHSFLAARSAYTILNCGMKNWPTERYFHMSLDLKRNEEPIDEDRIKWVLSKVEFPFKNISTLGRFFVIQLREPSVIQGESINPDEMQFLKRYLEYIGEEPVMHVSLVKVNDQKKQMTCVTRNLNQVSVPINPLFIEKTIQRAASKSKHVQMSAIAKSLSEISFWLLHLACGNVRSYLSQILKAESRENAIYNYVHDQANLCLHNFSQLPAVAQDYFFEEYGIHHDFTGQIGVKLDGNDYYPIDKRLVVELFLSIFLNHWDDPESLPAEFPQFKELVRFCLLKTKSRLNAKQYEISFGIRESENDDDSLGGLFNAESRDLPAITKARYIEENERDRAFLNELKEGVALFLIKARFFGINLNHQFFVEFINQNQSAIHQVRQCQVLAEHPSESLLEQLQQATRSVLGNKCFDKKFSLQREFDFRKFVGTLPSFACMPEDVCNELKDEILQKMEIVIQANTDMLRENATETVSFSDSKIQDATFWHACLVHWQGYFARRMKDTTFQFTDIKQQPNNDLADDDDD